MRLSPFAAALGLAVATTFPAAAQTVLNGNHSIDGKLCVGPGCTNSETFDTTVSLQLKHTLVHVDFIDTSSGGSPDREWRLWVNDGNPISSGGLERFSIRDVTSATTPFTIEGDAPNNAMWMDPDGEVGLGTKFPMTNLHIVDAETPGIRLESSGFGNPQWDIKSDSGVVTFTDVNTGNRPLRIYQGAGDNLLTVTNAGGVGIGTDNPQGWLTVNTDPVIPTGIVVQKGSFSSTPTDAFAHIRTDVGTAQLKVEEASTTTTPRSLLSLQNNGRPEIVLGNTSTNGEWSFGAGTNFVLKQGAVGTTSAAKTKYFTLFGGTGNLSITGQIITGGPTCSSGCDAVFSDDYDLPSIAEHAEAMFSLGHLPNVGPTEPGKPLNMSEQYGKLLNELEHAHIYIARQQALIDTQRAELDRFEARLTALEAQE